MPAAFIMQHVLKPWHSVLDANRAQALGVCVWRWEAAQCQRLLPGRCMRTFKRMKRQGASAGIRTSKATLHAHGDFYQAGLATVRCAPKIDDNRRPLGGQRSFPHMRHVAPGTSQNATCTCAPWPPRTLTSVSATCLAPAHHTHLRTRPPPSSLGFANERLLMLPRLNVVPQSIHPWQHTHDEQREAVSRQPDAAPRPPLPLVPAACQRPGSRGGCWCCWAAPFEFRSPEALTRAAAAAAPVLRGGTAAAAAAAAAGGPGARCNSRPTHSSPA